MNRSNYLFKNVLLLGLNSIGTRIIVFFLVPLYTNVLTTSEYGVVDLFTTILIVLIPITTLNIGEAVMRFSMDKNAPHKDISSIAILFMFLSVVLCLSIYPLLSFFPLLQPYKNFLFAYAAADSIFQTSNFNLRGRELLVDYAICNIILTLSIALLNILFLLVLGMGIKGYFLAYAIANVLGSAYAIYRGRLYNSLRIIGINTALAKQMIRYSIVLVPNSLMWWIMNSSDRIMVTSMVGIAQNGIYGVSYKIPTIMSTLVGVFNQAWNYTAVKESGSRDKDVINNFVFDKLLKIEVILIAGILTVLKPFMLLYVGKEFYSAWTYVPPLLIGFGFMTAGTFLSSAYTVHKDSKGFLISGTIGAVVNIILNFTLIPILGTMGAAIATCVSYIAVFLYRNINTKKYMRINPINKDIWVSLLILLCMSLLLYVNNHVILYIEILMLISILSINRDVFVIILSYLRGFMKRHNNGI